MSGLPSTWRRASLLEVAQFVRGVTYSKVVASDVPSDTAVPILRATNIQNRKLILQDLVYVPRDLVSDEQMVRRGDIVVATSSGSIDVVGKAAQSSDDMHAAFGAFCGLLRPTEGIEPRYLGYFMQSSEYRARVSSLARGVNINNLKRSHFEEIEIPLAPLAEQKRIADKLDRLLAAVDTCKARLDAIPDILKRFRQSVLAAAVSGGATGNGRRAATWSVMTLDEVRDPDRPISYGVLKPGEHDPSGTPLLRILDLERDLSNAEQLHRIPESLSKTYKRTILRGEEIVVSLVGTIGRVAHIPRSLAGANVHRNLAVIACGERVLPRYLYYALSDLGTQHQLSKMTSGANQPLLNLSDLRRVTIGVPSLNRQREVVQQVERHLSVANSIEKRLRHAQRYVRGIAVSALGTAFRGHLS